MKVEIANLDGTFPITLGDDAIRWYISGYLPKSKWESKIVRRTRASHVAIYPRYNEEWEISFRVASVHASYDDASFWYHDHPAMVPYQGILTVTNRRTTRYFPDATKVSITPIGELLGVTVEFEYRFIASKNVKA